MSSIFFGPPEPEYPLFALPPAKNPAETYEGSWILLGSLSNFAPVPVKLLPDAPEHL